jgi:hypothetical protein
LETVGPDHAAACWNWHAVEAEMQRNPLHRGALNLTDVIAVEVV